MTETLEAPEAPTPRSQRRRMLRTRSTKVLWFAEVGIVIVVAVVIAVVLRTFIVGTYSIPSGSMEPTLNINDRILVNKLAYHLGSIHRADIVVFTTPPTEHCGGPPVNDLVKRVVGLPGDTISLSGGYVYVNGTRLAQPWLPTAVQKETFPGPAGTPYALTQPFKVPAGEIYVMGDNREFSCDSRYWGPVKESTVVGKVDVRFWPLTRFHLF